jgi:hypothetical protein
MPPPSQPDRGEQAGRPRPNDDCSHICLHIEVSLSVMNTLRVT